MFILCDTSSILMLLRIAPDMFIDDRYECKTIREVHDEIVRQEFKDDFQGNVSPLEIIIHWIESGVIEWDQEKQGYLSAWAQDHEHPQPPTAKKRFKELSHFPYVGS